MVTELWHHIRGSMQPTPMTLEAMFAWNIRFEVITQTQEEFDFLYGMQLMFGRELEMKTWAEWKEEWDVANLYHVKKKFILPFAFTTFQLNFLELR